MALQLRSELTQFVAAEPGSVRLNRSRFAWTLRWVASRAFPSRQNGVGFSALAKMSPSALCQPGVPGAYWSWVDNDHVIASGVTQ